MPDEHPVDRLWREMASVEPYPDGVEPVPERLRGISFFPGGAGLWMRSRNEPLPAMPIGGVMLVGQDFYSRDGYLKVLDCDRAGALEPSKAATWPALKKVLNDACVPLSNCFFTNCYMGLRASSENTGAFSGSKCAAFVARCRAFFIRQLEAQRPRAILALGRHAHAFLAGVAPQLAGWNTPQGTAGIDAGGWSVVRGVTVPALPGYVTAAVALCHPSLRNANVGRRNFAGVTGHWAEVAMIRSALGVVPAAAA